MELIPAIDLMSGNCVRLEKGDFAQRTIYENDPLRMARRFESMGFRRLHMVDLDAARGSGQNLDVLERVAGATNLQIDFGGGVRSSEMVERALSAGASQVTLGSLAVSNRAQTLECLKEFGTSRLILGADARAGRIAWKGWQADSELDLTEFIDSYLQAGFRRVICTDIGRDGMLSGPAVDLYIQLLAEFPQMELIASGGVGNARDLHLLKDCGLHGAIFGKAWYEGKISTKELEALLC